MSGAPMTADEMRAALRRLGVSESTIESAIRSRFPDETEPSGVSSADGIAWPLRLVLPWTALCSDNLKTSAIITGSKEAPYPRLVASARYAEAKRKARKIAKQIVDGRALATIPLELIASVWVPDNRPGHDVCNLAKCAHDAFEGVIYTNDDLLHRVVWERAGVDVDAPRAEIEVRPL